MKNAKTETKRKVDIVRKIFIYSPWSLILLAHYIHFFLLKKKIITTAMASITSQMKR